MTRNKVKQVGPPLRIDEYQLSVTDGESGILARAILVDEGDRDDMPREILSTESGLIVKADNVASDGRVVIPIMVLRGLLKITGWIAKVPDSLNPIFKMSVGGSCPVCSHDLVRLEDENDSNSFKQACIRCGSVDLKGSI